MSVFCVNAFLLWGGIPQGQYPLAGFILPYQAGNDAGGTEAEKDIVHGAVYGERTLKSVDDFRRFRKKTAEEKGCIGGHEDDDEGKHSPARVFLPLSGTGARSIASAARPLALSCLRCSACRHYTIYTILVPTKIF